ncbi:MAG: hypothetical protein GXY50_04825 [Syntrophomonadaceae bacterium]|nr:hypothetical protein [Syntrophomonadaceae bacterium]
MKSKVTWKRMGSLFLAVCMIFTMLPMTAFAGTGEMEGGPPTLNGTAWDWTTPGVVAVMEVASDADLASDKEMVKSSQWSSASGAYDYTEDGGEIISITIGGYSLPDVGANQSGTGWSWIAATKTLTLTGAITGEIRFTGTATVNLVISGETSAESIYYTGGDIIISEAAEGSKLTLTRNNYNTLAAKNLTVESGAIQANVGGDWNKAIYLTGDLNLKEGALVLSGSGKSITGIEAKNISISGSASVTADSGFQAPGVQAGGDIDISGNAVVRAASTGNSGIHSSGKVEVSGNAQVIASSSSVNSSHSGIYAQTLIITGGSVTAKGTPRAVGTSLNNANITISGGTLTTGEKNADPAQGQIAGSLEVNGAEAEVTVHGNLTGDLTVSAGTVNINGAIDGNPLLQGGTLFINGQRVYQVSVTGGESDKKIASKDEIVILTADNPSGRKFQEWTIVPAVDFTEGTAKTDATAKFKMPAGSVAVTATYETVAELTGEETTIDISYLGDDPVTGGSNWEYTGKNGVDESLPRLLILKKGGLTLKGTNNSLAVKAPEEAAAETTDNFTITLDNVQITASEAEVFGEGYYTSAVALFSGQKWADNVPITLNLTGANSLMGTYGLISTGNLSLDGPGTLIVTATGYDGNGIDVYGSSCIINGPKVTASAASGEFPMAMSGGTLEIAANSSLTLDNTTGNNYSAALSDNDPLTVTVGSNAHFKTIAGTNNTGDPDRDFWFEAGTQNNTTIINNGGSVFIDGDVTGKAINNSGSFEVTGTVKESEGIITKPILPETTVDLASPVSKSEYYSISSQDGLTILTAKKAASFTLTGNAPLVVWNDKFSASTYIFDNMDIGKYEINSYRVTVKGTNHCGGTMAAGNTSGSLYSGDGTLNVSLNSVNISEGYANGLDSSDGLLTIDGPTVKVLGFGSSFHGVLLKSGLLTADSWAPYIEVEGGKASFDDTSSVYADAKWRVKHSGGELSIKTFGSLYDGHDYTPPTISILFDSKEGSPVPAIYLWGYDTYSVSKPANPLKDDHIFMNWSTEGSGSANFPFEVTASQTFSANWNSLAAGLHTVRVIGGTSNLSGGWAGEGTTVTITANPPAAGKVFDKWTTETEGVSFKDAAAPSTTFNIPDRAVTVTATYKDAPAGTYLVTVNGGSGGGGFAENATVSITADEPASGKVFDKWTTSDGINFANANSSATTFTMPARPVTVTATYKDAPAGIYLVTVNGGSGGGSFAANATVSITANDPASGKVFDKWTTSDGINFANANSSNTTFTMPAKPVTVTATYKNTGGGSSTTTPATTPAADGTVKVDYTTSNGVATLSMTNTQVDDIISQSQNGQAILDLQAAGNTAAVNIPNNALSSFENANLDVAVRLPEGTATINNEALASILAQAPNADLNLELNTIPTNTLTAAQQAAVKSGDLVFDINILMGSKNITEFDGALTIEVAYEGELPAAVWYLNDEGELEKLDCTFKDGVVSFNLNHLSLYVVGKDETVIEDKWVNPFTDVKTDSWYYEAVKYVYEKDLMKGTSGTTFDPNGVTSRGMIVVILHRLEGAPTAGTHGFSDVAAGKYYANAVAWASENKIVSGYDDGSFGPENSITREQMAAILMNYAGFKGYDITAKADLSKFADAQEVSTWAKDAISWANAQGLIQGDGNRLMPAGNATRAQAAAILNSFVEKVVR